MGIGSLSYLHAHTLYTRFWGITFHTSLLYICMSSMVSVDVLSVIDVDKLKSFVHFHGFFCGSILVIC